MAKPNYSFEKRQRELAKKKKKDEKDAKKRAERDAARPDAESAATGSDTASERVRASPRRRRSGWMPTPARAP